MKGVVCRERTIQTVQGRVMSVEWRGWRAEWMRGDSTGGWKVREEGIRESERVGMRVDERR